MEIKQENVHINSFVYCYSSIGTMGIQFKTEGIGNILHDALRERLFRKSIRTQLLKWTKKYVVNEDKWKMLVMISYENEKKKSMQGNVELNSHSKKVAVIMYN